MITTDSGNWLLNDDLDKLIYIIGFFALLAIIGYALRALVRGLDNLILSIKGEPTEKEKENAKNEEFIKKYFPE